MVGWVTSPFFFSDFLKLVCYAHVFPRTCGTHNHIPSRVLYRNFVGWINFFGNTEITIKHTCLGGPGGA